MGPHLIAPQRLKGARELSFATSLDNAIESLIAIVLFGIGPRIRKGTGSRPGRLPVCASLGGRRRYATAKRHVAPTGR